MAKYARIDSALTVTQFVEIDDPATIPKHKKWQDGGLYIRPVVEGPMPPAFRPELYMLSTNMTVEAERVVVTHEAIPKDQRAAVKAEAQRRIVAITGAQDVIPAIIKQINAIMRSVKLVDKKASGAQLTASEEAEAAALMALATQVEAIRAASNEIEAIEPVPDDFDANARWPA